MNEKNERKETSGIGSSNGFDGWIDVKKQLPADTGLYLVSAPDGDKPEPFVTVAWYKQVGLGWSVDGYPKAWTHTITHWRPLPPAPAQRFRKFDDTPIPSNGLPEPSRQ